MRYKISWHTVLFGLSWSFVVYSPPSPLEPHLRASFSRHRANSFATAEICISPPPPSHQKPHFHCSSLLSKFKPSVLLTGSSASSPATLLLAAPPPRWLPFFLQRRLLVGDPSCSAASSLATLLLAAPPPHRRPFFLLRGLLAADPSSCCAPSSIWSGNPHPTHTILLLSRPTCLD